MRKTLACVCVIALLPTGVLGQAPGEPPPSPAPSPLSRSIASAIAAVPLDAPVPPLAGDQDRDEASGWLRVEALQPGTEVRLTVTGTPAVKAQLLVARHDAVFVLRPGGPNLSGRVSRALSGVGSQWPAVFSGGAAYALADGVRVAEGPGWPVGHRPSDCPRPARLLRRQPHHRGHALPRASTGWRPGRRPNRSADSWPAGRICNANGRLLEYPVESAVSAFASRPVELARGTRLSRFGSSRNT